MELTKIVVTTKSTFIAIKVSLMPPGVYIVEKYLWQSRRVSFHAISVFSVLHGLIFGSIKSTCPLIRYQAMVSVQKAAKWYMFCIYLMDLVRFVSSAKKQCWQVLFTFRIYRVSRNTRMEIVPLFSFLVNSFSMLLQRREQCMDFLVFRRTRDQKRTSLSIQPAHSRTCVCCCDTLDSVAPRKSFERTVTSTGMTKPHVDFTTVSRWDE